MMSERNYNGHDFASSGALGGGRGQLATLPDGDSFREELGNLPLQISSFVGREREVAEIKGLLSSTRLLTLTGPGGCGKTRLALAVASDLAESFDDGAWWVGLASLSEPKLVPQEVASALEVRETPGRSFVEALADHILRQIALHNPTLNAIVTLDEKLARQRAKEADAALAREEIWGPLHGVPATIKDAFETTGMRTTGGYKPLANYVPEHDATVVARLCSAGAIILGKTNMSMLATDYQSDSPVFGPASNPWDERRTAGGSSGGSGGRRALSL